MICAVEMVDESGENTSKGEHQAECVWSNDEQWNIMGRHLWYLTEIIILFSLFSSKVDDDMKSRIAAKLVSLTPDDTIKFGLPTYPDLTPATELSDLVTGKSWQLFTITGTGSEWLKI